MNTPPLIVESAFSRHGGGVFVVFRVLSVGWCLAAAVTFLKEVKVQRYTFWTNMTASIPAPEGTAVFTYKKPGASPVSSQVYSIPVPFITGEVPFSAIYQMTDASGNVLAEGEIEVKQDLAHAPANYDHRSEARKTLEALDAKIAGRALTIQQSRVSVDGKSIDYINSIDELMKWRNYFARLVAKEEGHRDPKNQLCVLRRG